MFKIVKSNNKNKRYTAIYPDNKKISFGSPTGSTYIDHGDEVKRRNYLKRHQVNEDWTNPRSAGALSALILWGKNKDINKNIENFKNKFF